MVAAHDHEGFSVGSENHRVRSVFTTTLQSAQGGDIVELIIHIGVVEIIETTSVTADTASVHADVEPVKCPQQALASADLGGNFFDLEFLTKRNTPDPRLALVAAVEPALVVDGHGNPGSLLALGDGVDLLDLKAVRVDDGLTIGSLFLLGGLLRDASEDDVLDLDLHRPTGVKLKGDHAG